MKKKGNPGQSAEPVTAMQVFHAGGLSLVTWWLQPPVCENKSQERQTLHLQAKGLF